MTGYESMATKCEEQSVAVRVRALAMVLIVAVVCADSVPPPMSPWEWRAGEQMNTVCETW